MLVFAPLLVADIRAPVSTTVTACDASPWACAGVTADFDEAVVRELWRFRDRRGGYVRCETPFEALSRDILEAGADADVSLLEEALAEDGAALPRMSAHERQFSWVSELADAVGWRSEFRYPARLSDHINLKEARAYRTVVRRIAGNAGGHNRRHLTLQDSFVVRGASAKGRSSTRKLNGVLRPGVPEVLAANITVGSLAVPTKHNPADAPTRDSPVRRRPAIACPAWLADLARGEYVEWDARYGAGPRATPAVLFPEGTGPLHDRRTWTQRGATTEGMANPHMAPSPFAHERHGDAGAFTTGTDRWRFQNPEAFQIQARRVGPRHSGRYASAERSAVRLARPAPPPSRRFDSTKGFPGEGPANRRSRSEIAARRATVDIRGSRAGPDERARRAAAVEEFATWLVECGIPGTAIDTFSGEDLAPLLVEDGQVQFRRGASVNSLKAATFGLQDRRNGIRVFMKPVWATVTNWEREEPADSHVPLPAVAFAAALAVCFSWGWLQMLAALIVGWLSLARPGELLKLRRRDLILPSDLGLSCAASPGFVVFRHPKGSWGRNAARVEHVRISDAAGLAFLEAYAAGLDDAALLFPDLAEGTRFRRSWDSVFGESLGFVCRDVVGLTPASLRAGAGTDLYVRTNDPARFQWLARHVDQQTARRYLQEHTAALVYARLPHARRGRVEELARLAPALLREATVSLRSPRRAA